MIDYMWWFEFTLVPLAFCAGWYIKKRRADKVINKRADERDKIIAIFVEAARRKALGLHSENHQPEHAIWRGNGDSIIIDSAGNVLTSPDGISWTSNVQD